MAASLNPPFSDYFQHSNNAKFGCQVASAAWDHRQLIYAIEKLKLSWRLDWFTLHSASPRHGQVFDNLHSEFTYHTNAAFAIIAAYSAIEELGLEVRSSSQKPRFTGASKDEWNPDVKSDLEIELDQLRG